MKKDMLNNLGKFSIENKISEIIDFAEVISDFSSLKARKFNH